MARSKPAPVDWIPSQTEDWALDPGEYEKVMAGLPAMTEADWERLGAENAADYQVPPPRPPEDRKPL